MILMGTYIHMINLRSSIFIRALMATLLTLKLTINVKVVNFYTNKRKNYEFTKSPARYTKGEVRGVLL